MKNFHIDSWDDETQQHYKNRREEEWEETAEKSIILFSRRFYAKLMFLSFVYQNRLSLSEIAN